MCRSMEIMRNEAAIQASIQASIKALSSCNVPDEKISEYLVAYLLENFDFLSKEEAIKLVREYED